MDSAPQATVVLDPEDHRGPIDRRLFGSFVEHMGRCVHTGIYEPDHPSADASGFRTDVADLVRELGVSLVRYPGGNFVSGYDWTDGIGPREHRPRRLDLAWRSIETNQVGTDEFVRWAHGLGVSPMMAVNLGTAGVREAAALVEYCNVPQGTYWSDLRRANGSSQPYGVGLWCLGNEMDGPWQTGHKSADQYAALAAEAAKAMRMVDSSIELVACGSSYHEIPTFGYWESTVLERAGEYVDYVSMHAYYQEHDDDRASFLASGAAMDSFIRDVVATIDATAARTRSRRRVNISFDEWNVWYQTRYAALENTPIDVSGPRIEDIYSTVDAVVVGDLLTTLINHADRVKIGCLAQLVNVIAPIMTVPGGPAWRQSIYHPFAAVAAACRGVSLVTRVRTADVSTRRHGDVPSLAAAASHDPDEGRTTVLLTNRATAPATVELRHSGGTRWATRSARVLVADDRGPRHQAEAAEVGLSPLPVHDDPEARTTRLRMPPQSWAIVQAVNG